MAAVTAAAISAAVAVGGAAYSATQQASSGGGGGGNPKHFGPVPEDPQDEAMKNYYARLVAANVNTPYKSFSGYLGSGGDPAAAAMDVTIPEMKPSEAAKLGFVGGHGEDIPGYDPTSGATSLTPEQRIYLAKERVRAMREKGQEAEGWPKTLAERTHAYNVVGNRLENLQAIEDPTQRQQRRIERLTNRQSRIRERLQNQLGGELPPGYRGGA